MKATGTNTAAMTNEIATIAPLISFMASVVASKGDRCFSSIFTCTASMTTMASSTTIPMAMTKAKRDIKLSVMPKAFMTAKVPIKETGTARIGIMAERQSPKNMNTTNATKMKASNNVWATLSIDAFKNREMS